ncbi:C45 family peptidase [Saccharopolyspora indica]|uniref:C45 family autoproteolytic acyltransferase/hydolase n=1 Tax=Saccharopolyspora indica TaxID=1229659 RepID=UPI0022EAA8EB|nr:C45 family peptidase [Saccharopolyspora indica]MDA3647960.1 C45 family autoproteolytic acyltransferase/hydrolase [Saccharopolyspora indica]
MNALVPRHASTETEPAARGRELGAACRDGLRETFAGYARLFTAHGLHPHQVRDHGAAALAEIGAWAPSLGAEIAGMAEGSGLPAWQLGALNARTEILAAAAVTGEGECSTSVVLPGDGTPPRTVQTWDWHDVLRGAMLAWTLTTGTGRRVATFTEFGVVGKIGVNDAGLGLHFNVLRHRSDGAEIGVPVHVVARRILDEATTADDAVRIARSARLSASSVLTVVTRDGARCVELCPAGVAELHPENGFLLHTNHFLDPSLASGERTTADVSSTLDRYAWLREHGGAALGAEDRTERARALCVHRDSGAPICAHADLALPAHERWESLATLSIDVAAHSLHVHHGGPCTVDERSWITCSTGGGAFA